MFAHLVLSEWKEKAPVLGAGLLIVILWGAAFSLLGGGAEAAEPIAACLYVALVPGAALIFGGSAFDRERRDAAWAFLFSRPVRRGTIWLAKLAAALGLTLALFGAVVAMIRLWPGFASAAQRLTSSIPGLYGAGLGTLSFEAALVVLASALAISFVSEKTLAIVFLAPALALAAFGLWFLVFVRVLPRTTIEPSGALFRTAPVLLAVAIAAAGYVAFVRSDFSQPRRKAAALAGWGGAFLGGAILLVAGAVKAEDALRGRDWFAHVTASERIAWIGTGRGLFRFDPGRDRLVRAGGRSYDLQRAVRDRVLVRRFGSTAGESLWAVAGDGSSVRLDGELSRFPGDSTEDFRQIASAALSPDARRVAFTTTDAPARLRVRAVPRTESVRLWVVEADGTNLKEIPVAWTGLPLVPSGSAILGWSGDGTGVFAFVGKSELHDVSASSYLVRIGLDDAKLTVLGRSGRSFLPLAYYGSAIAGNSLAALIEDGSGERLALFDTRTLQVSEVARGKRFGLVRLSPDGRRLVFVARDSVAVPGRAFVYADGEVHDLGSADKVLGCAWKPDGGFIAALWKSRPGDRTVAGESRLMAVPADLSAVRAIATPFDPGNSLALDGTTDAAIVVLHGTNRVWRFSYATGEWKRLM